MLLFISFNYAQTAHNAYEQTVISQSNPYSNVGIFKIKVVKTHEQGKNGYVFTTTIFDTNSNNVCCLNVNLIYSGTVPTPFY